MAQFEKINHLVEMFENNDRLMFVNIILNKERTKDCKYGKYCKPLCVIYVLDDGEDIVVENPNYLLKIPGSCVDCINILGTKYSAIRVDVHNPKIYESYDGEKHKYYECSVNLIRNPLTIKKCEEIEASIFNIGEFTF